MPDTATTMVGADGDVHRPAPIHPDDADHVTVNDRSEPEAVASFEFGEERRERLGIRACARPEVALLAPERADELRDLIVERGVVGGDDDGFDHLPSVHRRCSRWATAA